MDASTELELVPPDRPRPDETDVVPGVLNTGSSNVGLGRETRRSSVSIHRPIKVYLGHVFGTISSCVSCFVGVVCVRSVAE